MVARVSATLDFGTSILRTGLRDGALKPGGGTHRAGSHPFVPGSSALLAVQGGTAVTAHAAVTCA